ncbi:hypothetical protein ACLKA6_010480 [Drosophila palustris]
MSSKNTRTLPLSTDQLLLTSAMQSTQPEKRKRPDVSPDNTLQNIMGAIQQISDRNLETALNIANNSKSLWDLVRKINGTSQSKVIKVDVQALAAHFERILCRNMPILQHHFALPYTTILEMDREIEVVEVTDAIARCKVRKAPGEDRVSAEFFKNASPLFISQVTTTFNKIFATANVPDSFRKNVINPIFKKGNALEPENYRGISFINAVAKVFTSVILARLTKWLKVNDILGEHQAGFREGYSTVDSIFSLTAIANHHLAQKKKMHAFFVDFKAAFDTIDRNSLYLKLSNLANYFKDGIDAQAISLIFRARTEVLRLSYVPHSSLDSRCTLCSTGEAEDTAHFIARCPMLSELRVLHFGQTRLNTTEINDFLNGSDWGSLVAYLRDATRYRQFIMDS